jgi:maleate cis-trans isomerase
MGRELSFSSRGRKVKEFVDIVLKLLLLKEEDSLLFSCVTLRCLDIITDMA